MSGTEDDFNLIVVRVVGLLNDAVNFHNVGLFNSLPKYNDRIFLEGMNKKSAVVNILMSTYYNMHVTVYVHSQKVFLGNGVNFALNIFPHFFMYADLTPPFSVYTVTTNENRLIILSQDVSFRAPMDKLAV